MSTPSATLAAHRETLARLRELVQGMLVEDVLLPVEIPRNGQQALRELDRLEGIAADFEAELDRLAESLSEANEELMGSAGDAPTGGAS